MLCCKRGYILSLLRFKGSWRSYQQRILDNLNFHLRDEKLHIVAAPGAGKTTLGIEVISRLNQSALILCPTNTIKNQWRDRICEAFLEENDYDKVSTDIRNPKYITIITYQALLAAFCGLKYEEENIESVDENEYNYDYDEDAETDSITGSRRFNQKKADEVIAILKDAKVTLLCFDEAHHLRKEWWKALTYLCENLSPRQTLSLTATPPYDADINEWNRYAELCGEIDEVISIPELVKNGDLCPHQDFIYFSCLKDSEKELVKKHINSIKKIIEKLVNDDTLAKYLSEMKFMKSPEDELEEILDNPNLYVSIVSLLHSLNYRISPKFLKIFNAKEYEIPKFNAVQAKVFLNNFIITNSQKFSGLEEKIEDYKSFAHKSGLIHNNKIVFNESAKIQRQIACSTGKLDSIADIVDIELKSLGNNLRMVVLADYIKANDTDNSHLGVVPIWRVLKTKYTSSDVSLGVLCGSLIIIPKTTENDFYKLLEDNDISKSDVSVSTYVEDGNYLKITPKETTKNSIVRLITDMFNYGYITVLIGTQALLGEGWDAPCINSLILSSTVSSYMLSNQMRGRAIRIDKNCPEKISNIWHLASIGLPEDKSIFQSVFGKVSSLMDEEDDANSLFYDYEQLKRRFEGFEAPALYNKHEICNGLERVLSSQMISKLVSEKGEKGFLSINDRMVKFAQDRAQTKQLWDKALNLGYNVAQMSLRHGVEAQSVSVKTLTYKGYKQICISLFWLMLSIIISIDLRMGIYIHLVIIVVFLFIFGAIGLKYLKTGSASGVMKQIAIVMLESLASYGFIKTSLKNVGLSIKEDDEGLYVSCCNLSTEENKLFIKCLQEFLNPVENPRYLLIKYDKFLSTIKQEDYFSIPAILSANKSAISTFKSLWNKYVGECEIIYTRNTQGRMKLLMARKNAFSSMQREKTKRLSKWQ